MIIMSFRVINRLSAHFGSFYGYHTTSVCLQDHGRFRRSIGLVPEPNRTPEFHQHSDYSFTDSRPTPVTPGQLSRIKRHRELTAAAVQHLKEIEFIEQRHAKKLATRSENRQRILESKLKPKGDNIKNEKEPAS